MKHPLHRDVLEYVGTRHIDVEHYLIVRLHLLSGIFVGILLVGVEGSVLLYGCCGVSVNAPFKLGVEEERAEWGAYRKSVPRTSMTRQTCCTSS